MFVQRRSGLMEVGVRVTNKKGGSIATGPEHVKAGRRGRYYIGMGVRDNKQGCCHRQGAS